MDIEALHNKLLSVINEPDRLAINTELPIRLSKMGLWSKRLSVCSSRYFYLYTGPIAEMLFCEKSLDSYKAEPYWSKLLEAHTLLAFSLRIMDDVVDGDIRGKLMMKAIRQAENLQLEAIICLRRLNKSWGRDAQDLFHRWIRYEESIIEGGILSFNDLWQRASPLMVIPDLYIQAPIEILDAYRQYLSLLMLVHDIQDIIDDIKAGRRTMPSEIMLASGQQILLTPTSIESYFQHFIPIVNDKFHNLKKIIGDHGFKYWSFLLDNIEQQFWN
jgi:hypothetical protein